MGIAAASGPIAQIDLWASIVAPIAVGVLLWLAADWFRAWRGRRAEKFARRRRIVSLVGRGRALLFRAIRDRLYDEAFINKSMKPLDQVRREYDDLTVEALDLFVPGEGEVAFWTAVELYAGFWDPLVYLDEAKVARQPREDGEALLGPGSEGEGYESYESGVRTFIPGYALPRVDRLRGWAEGIDPGPRYGDLYRDGDKLRHRVARPNSDVNVDMLRPPLRVEGSEIARTYSREHRRWRKSGDPWF